MTRYSYTWNNTDGVDATAVATGFTTRAIGTGGSITFRTSAAWEGSTGLRFVAAGGSSLIQKTLDQPAMQLATSLPFTVPSAVPTAAYNIHYLFDSTSARIYSIIYSTSGVFQFADKNNALTTIITAAQATAGRRVRFEIEAVVGTTVTNGQFTVKAYDASGAQIGTTATSSAANLGTVPITKTQFGIINAVTATLEMDTVQFDDGMTYPQEIGFYAPLILTIVQNGPVQFVDARTSTAGKNGALTYTAAYVSGPSLLYNQVTDGYYVFYPDPVSDSVYTITIAEAGNGSTAQNVTIAALPSGGRVDDGDAPVDADPGNTDQGSSITETVVRTNGQWV